MLRGIGPHILVRAIGDEIDRIGAATVLGEARIVEIELPGDLIHHDIFQHGAKTLGRREDFRLGIGRQADHLA